MIYVRDGNIVFSEINYWKNIRIMFHKHRTSENTIGKVLLFLILETFFGQYRLFCIRVHNMFVFNIRVVASLVQDKLHLNRNA